MDTDLCREILGARKEVCTEGLLWEVGREPLSWKIEERWLNYVWGLKWEHNNRSIQCLRESQKLKGNWKMLAEKRLAGLELQELWNSGEGVRKTFRKELKV